MELMEASGWSLSSPMKGVEFRKRAVSMSLFAGTSSNNSKNADMYMSTLHLLEAPLRPALPPQAGKESWKSRRALVSDSLNMCASGLPRCKTQRPPGPSLCTKCYAVRPVRGSNMSIVVLIGDAAETISSIGLSSRNRIGHAARSPFRA